MKKVLITGALGQIGSELVERLRNDLGKENVIATDIRTIENNPVCEEGIFHTLNVLDYDSFLKLAKEHQVDTIIHLAALLSATAEKNPKLGWDLNMNGLINGLEVAKELNTKFFSPSSIAAFGPDAEPNNTPQDTVMNPQTMYGVTKVAGELLANYYFTKYGVDTRSVRFPGLISYKVEPGGGTTDYAVDIYYQALLKGEYNCYIKEGTKMDMMYMDDAIDSIVQLMNIDPTRLKHRNAFNISAMSFEPNQIFASIKKYVPHFKMNYDVCPIRQKIAESWPNNIDSSAAIEEWDFKPKFDLDSMTQEMLKKLSEKLKIQDKNNVLI